MSGLVRYPVPLAIDRMGFLYLPSDLTPHDVKRVVAYVKALTPDADDLPSDRAMRESYQRVSRVAGESR